MANQDSPFGLRAVRDKTGAAYCGQFNPYFVDEANAEVMAVGDLVVLSGGSFTASATSSVLNHANEDGMYATIELATPGAGNPILGVIQGFEPRENPSPMQDHHRAAGERRIVHVADDPSLVFEALFKADGEVAAPYTAFANAMVGMNVDIAYTAPELIYGRAQSIADAATLGVVANQQLRIVGLQRRSADNVANSTDGPSTILVTINNHQNALGTVGV